MRSLKALMTVIGAVTVLVLAGNTVALAATGHAFILGKTNKANQVTVLKRTTPGSALSLKTTSTANAPLSTNARGKVANLNSDLLDGFDSSDLGTRAYATVGAGGLLNPSDFDGPIGGSTFGLTQSNVTAHSVTGTYCFHPSFTPKSAQVSAIGDLGAATSSFIVATVTVRTNHGLSNCGTNDTVRVRTFIIPADPGSPSLSNQPFILWIK